MAKFVLLTFRFGLLGVAFLLFALGQGRAVTEQDKSAWRADWDKVVSAAKKEGRVVLYASESYDAVFREFHKKYPEIKVIMVPGRTSQVTSRAMAEQRAGKYLGDVFLGGSGSTYAILYKGRALDPISDAFVLPEVIDTSKWWRRKRFYHDDESRYILAFNGIPQSYFQYNTKLVNPAGIKSYWDFLDPQWKGKIVTLDPTMRGSVSGFPQFIYHNPKLGVEFLRRFLSESELTATRDFRLLVDWLAVGKFSISSFAPPNQVGIYEAKKMGLPVDIFDAGNFKEGIPLSTAGGNMALFKNAPHPNAAKVAINWLLSREGQIAY